MSAVAKTRHIEVVFGKVKPKIYLVPLDKAHSIQKLIEDYKHEPDEDEYIDIDEAFKFLEKDRKT